MAKSTVFRLNVTLKAGPNVYLKGTTFSEDTLPAELKPDIDNATGTIEVISYGEDFEGSSFNPDESVSVKEPKRKLKPRKKA